MSNNIPFVKQNGCCYTINQDECEILVNILTPPNPTAPSVDRKNFHRRQSYHSTSTVGVPSRTNFDAILKRNLVS